jgi:hypothetical protein
LSGIESVQVYLHCLFIHALPLEIKFSKGDVLTLLYCYACLDPGHVFPTYYVMVFYVFSE